MKEFLSLDQVQSLPKNILNTYPIDNYAFLYVKTKYSIEMLPARLADAFSEPVPAITIWGFINLVRLHKGDKIAQSISNKLFNGRESQYNAIIDGAIASLIDPEEEESKKAVPGVKPI